MKKNLGFVVFGIVLLLGACASISKKSDDMDNREEMEFIEKQLVSLEQIVGLHKEIKNIDISLQKLYPVAVVRNNVFFIFDLDQSGERYEYKMEYPSGNDIPEGVLASYPLEFYEMKAAAVISEAAFETVEGRSAIFHEFVHCFQWDEGEWDLRQTLAIAREAWEKQDFMWELNHPFPYESDSFIQRTMELDSGYDIGKYHSEMKAELSEKDFEYMIWQEWKEGYARYIENLVRERLGVSKNGTLLTLPFERPVFYRIGSRYIETLIKNNPELKGNVKALFQKMINCEI